MTRAKITLTAAERDKRRGQIKWLRQQDRWGFQLVINYEDEIDVYHLRRESEKPNKLFCTATLDDPDYFPIAERERAVLRQGICEKCYQSATAWVKKQPKPVHPSLNISRIEYIDFNHALTEEYLLSGKTRKGKSNSRDLRNARLYRTGDGELVLQAKCGEEYGLSLIRLQAVLEAAQGLVLVSADLAPSAENDGTLDDEEY